MLGEPENYNIRGVWFWKGPEKLALLEDNPSSEFFFYRKLDIENEQDWQLIQDYFSLVEADISNRKLEGETVV